MGKEMKGILITKEDMENFNSMSPKAAMQLINAMFDYQMNGTEPENLPKRVEMIFRGCKNTLKNRRKGFFNKTKGEEITEENNTPVAPSKETPKPTSNREFIDIPGKHVCDYIRSVYTSTATKNAELLDYKRRIEDIIKDNANMFVTASNMRNLHKRLSSIPKPTLNAANDKKCYEEICTILKEFFHMVTKEAETKVVDMNNIFKKIG